MTTRLSAENGDGLNSSAARGAAESYLSRGWAPVPIPPREKGPTIPGWQNLRLSAADIASCFGPNANVGILLGGPSGGLIDVDLDHADALRLADEFLPPTLTFGRPGKPRSHRLYVCDPIPATKQFKNAAREMVVELRSTGAQTVFPPSVHESGETIAFDGDSEPARIGGGELLALVADLARAAGAIERPAGNLVNLVDPTATPGDGRPSAPDAFERCRAYMACLKDAISGAGGHNATLEASATCARFGLSESEHWDLLTQYNLTRCHPAWSERELRHKLREGRKLVEREGKFGSKLDEGRGRAAAGCAEPAGVGSADPADASGAESQQAGGEKAEEFYGLEIINGADVVMEDIPWLWKDRIARGAISILAGPRAKGKGVVTASLAALVTNGAVMPDGEQAERGDVLFMSAEDHIRQVLAPRLSAAGADMSRVHFAKRVTVKGKDGQKEVRPFQLSDVKQLSDAIDRLPDLRLIVIDPIGSFLGENTKSDKDNSVRAVLQPLADVAEDHGVATMLVAHYRKAEAFDADDKIMGSAAFVNLARNVWHICPEPENGRTLVLAGKSNNAAESPGLAFETEGVNVAGLTATRPVARWQPEPIQMNANDWLKSQQGEPSRGPKPEQAAKAEEFLTGLLKGRGPMPSQDVDEAAEAAEVGKSTLNRAKKKLGIACWRQGDGRNSPWMCMWPEDQTAIIESLIESARARRMARSAERPCAN